MASSYQTKGAGISFFVQESGTTYITSTGGQSDDELSYDEQREREQLERLVERAFYEAGRALKQLRDRRLYRDSHETFEDYCKERFAFTRRHVDYLVAGSQVVENLIGTNGSQTETSEMRTICSQILPTNECQVRPLAKLEPEQQRECWHQAVKAGGDKVPSGNVVKSIVDKIRERTKIPVPYSKGEVCTIITKDNPDLKGKGGHWCIVGEVYEYIAVKF